MAPSEANAERERLNWVLQHYGDFILGYGGNMVEGERWIEIRLIEGDESVYRGRTAREAIDHARGEGTSDDRS